MTPERERLLDAVAEAVEILEGGTYVIRGRAPEDADIYAHELGHIRYLMECIDALRAHDAAHPREGGEVVEEPRKIVQITTAFDSGDGYGESRSSYQPALVTTALCTDGTIWWKHHHDSPWVQHQSIPARVPLSAVPTIPATVEEVKR